MNIFEFVDYRQLIRAMVEHRRKTDSTSTFSWLADSIRVQRSYLSHVLKGRADLNADQIYLVGEKLGLSEEELDYLELLLAIERCQVEARRRTLVKRREKIRQSKVQAGAYLGLQTVEVSSEALSSYYMDPLCSFMHLALSIPAYRKDPKLAAARFGVDERRVVAVLDTLERGGIIRSTKKGYELAQPNLHLSHESPLSRVHATSFRLKAIEKRQAATDPDDYFFTATLSGNDEMRRKLKVAFMAWLEEIRGIVGDAPCKDVYHVNFDLFRV